ncbi:MAG: protein kinase [Myxococcales bacterium]|nr:protein kinase [Myxococcales bacterium]
MASSDPRAGPKPASAPAVGSAPRLRSSAEEELPAVRPYGKYFLVRKIAEGGMAEIFLAKQVGAEGFERNVVIKRMLQHLSNVPDFVGMFLDEARLAARLAHQNIIQINDLGLADGCYYICMEYLAGEDFSTVLRTAARRREYLPVGVTLSVIAGAAHGLHFAHEFTDEQGKPLNVVHRDISPSNIYVTYEGQVKLLDFGIAKAESRVTRTTAGVVKGKYMYMSPEQAEGDPVDRRADIFSLGVSLFEGLTNVRPFAHDNDLAILNAVLKCDFPRPRAVRSDLSPELEAIILKAMAPRVEDRYATAGQMAADIERFLAAGSQDASVRVYLRTLFGEERFNHKTRIPSLAKLAASGVDVPGFSNPYAPKTDAGAAVADARGAGPATISVGAATKTGPLVRPRGALFAALGGAVAVVAALGLGASLAFLRPSPAGGQPGEEQVAAAQEDAGAAGPALASELQDAGEPARAEADAGRVPRPPVVLTAAAIQKVVQRNSADIMRCFERYRDELASDRGAVNVTFSIVASGRVTVAKAEVGGEVGKCLEGRVKALRFPPHRDKEVWLTLPLKYEVKR